MIIDPEKLIQVSSISEEEGVITLELEEKAPEVVTAHGEILFVCRYCNNLVICIGRVKKYEEVPEAVESGNVFSRLTNRHPRASPWYLTSGESRKETTMCNCIEQLSNKVKREKHAACVRFEHFGAYRSKVKYQPYRLDGQPYRHNRYTSVPWKFCPFCGKEVAHSSTG